MHKVYQNETPPYKFSQSLFLAGGSIREGQEGMSWRKEALRILDDVGYKGVVYLPENREGRLEEHQDTNWEQNCLDTSDVILMWLPANDTLPCYGSRVEYGRYATTGRLVLGYPEDAQGLSYIHHDSQKLHIPLSHSLTHTIQDAMDLLGDGVERSLGERCIPLQVWKTHQFQSWYKNLLKSHNRLESAKVLYNISSEGEIGITLFRPCVYIAEEDRVKDEETVIARSDTVSVCLWKEVEESEDTEIVLVKEFRAPANNKSGYVYELPGGACENDEDAQEAAIREVLEEVGLDLEEERLKYVGSRQVYATLLAHKAHLFAYHLNEEELEKVKSQKGIAKGVKKEGEKCWTEIVRLSHIRSGNIVDWNNLGQISVAAGRL